MTSMKYKGGIFFPLVSSINKLFAGDLGRQSSARFVRRLGMKGWAFHWAASQVFQWKSHQRDDTLLLLHCWTVQETHTEASFPVDF